MKKIILLVSIFGLMFSCSGNKEQTEKISVEIEEQIEVIEKSTQTLDKSLKISDVEMEKNQNEIDSLLNEI